ncbi:hypothetical protein NPIL_27641, partial [Nephila pilipes]
MNQAQSKWTSVIEENLIHQRLDILRETELDPYHEQRVLALQ